MKRKPPVSRVGDLTPRKRRRRIVESGLMMLGCVVLAGSLIGERGCVANIRARQEARAEQRLLEEERRKTAALRQQKHLLESDLGTIEDAARRELNFIKPGEKVFIITDVPASSTR